MVGPDESGGLKVLRLRIRPAGSSVAVVFELAVGGEVRGGFETQLEELGWQTTPRSDEPQDPARSFFLPPTVADALTALIRPVLAEGEILWLRFSRPSGGLGLLPWERGLVPLLGSPVVRWPYFDLEPVKIGQATEVAVCATMPQSKHPFALPALLGPIVQALGRSSLQARFHVFVDASLAPAVRTTLREEIAEGRVRLVPAQSAKPFGEAPRTYDLSTDSDEIESPWLRWMLAEGPPRLDLVIFLSHGFLAASRGALAFSESPLRNRDRSWARFVGSQQLRRFLDRSGAAMLALVSPPDNHNLSGLYALADEIARDRPGPVLVHDLGEGDPDTLGPTLSLLLGKGTGPLPLSEARALYALPEQVAAAAPRRGRPGGFSAQIYELLEVTPDDVEEVGRKAVEAFTVASVGEVSSTEVEPSPPVPTPKTIRSTRSRKRAGPSLEEQGEALLATSQRVLERLSGDLLRMEETTSEIGLAARKGQANALKFVAGLLKGAPTPTAEK